MAYKNFHEVFTEVENAKGRADKIAVLQKHSSGAMKAILGFTYDPGVVWLLPETNPPYKPFDVDKGEEPLRLGAETRKFYLFVKGYTPAQKNIQQAKREQLFIDLLESLHPDEAKILMAMKTKKLPYKGLTQKLVAEAFPNLAKHW